MKSEQNNRSLMLPGLAAVPLVIISADFAGIHGSIAQTLKLPLSIVLPFTPIVVVALYFVVGLLLRDRLGTIGWVAAYTLATAASAAPVLVVHQYAEAIPVTRWLEPDETAAFRAPFPHPYVHCAGIKGYGPSLLIRKSDDHEQLIEYLQSIDAYPAAKQ